MPDLPRMISELKSLVLEAGITEDAKTRNEAGKNGSRPSLGLVGWLKMERGTDGSTAGGSFVSVAATGRTATARKKPNAIRQPVKNCLLWFMRFTRRWVSLER